MRSTSIAPSFIWIALPVALAIAPASLQAQLSGGAGLGALAQRQAGTTWKPGTVFGPTVTFDRPFSQLGLDGLLVGSSEGVRLDRGVANATLSPAPFGPLRLTTAGIVERATPMVGPTRSALTVESTISLKVGASGFWAGGAIERSREIDSLPTAPLLRLGAWRRFGNAVVTVSSASHAMRLGGRPAAERTIYRPDSSYSDSAGWHRFTRAFTTVDSARASRTTRWSDLELRGSWSFGRAAFDATAGTRRAAAQSPASSWARINTTIELTHGLALTAGAGTAPDRAAVGMPGSRFASLGLRVAPAALLRPALPPAVRGSPAAFRIDRVGPTSYSIEITAPSARTVELSGDFNGWKPVTLQRERPNVWSITLPLTPGTYRMNMRVDGDAWRAPPGTATIADEFNGTVGLVVVR